MRKKLLILWVIPLAIALAGCGSIKAGSLFKGRKAVQSAAQTNLTAGAKPLDTSAISTQTLAPATAGTATPTGRVIGAAPAPAPLTPPAAATAFKPAQDPAAIGAAATAALKLGSSASTPKAEAAKPAAETAKPAAATAAAPPASPEEAACVKGGGRWGKAGNTGAETCFHPSKDAGKSCNKESDCTSQCLARSRTCAPFWPIFGCTEVLQQNGATVKLCLE